MKINWKRLALSIVLAPVLLYIIFSIIYLFERYGAYILLGFIFGLFVYLIYVFIDLYDDVKKEL